MENKRERIELLAPARDAAAGVEAINHGADAVYIGGPAFGARSAVPNSISDIEKLARHAHLFNARVYLALNTILTDEELPQAEKIAREAWDAGVDALIIQDMGLLELDLPPLALHASTQCDNRDAEKVLFLEKCGFSQVVLARELSLPQIREIAQKTTVNLEVFIHGALCVSFSGNCYLSQRLCGRSANRGECAQPCRLPMTLLDSEKKLILGPKHLLSLRDLNQTQNLGALLAAGVTSFKIEGRLKDLGYVKNVTAHYRRELDSLLEGTVGKKRSSTGKSTFFFEPDPKKSFNRGFTEYFLNGLKDEPASFDTPKDIGEFIGTAKSLKRPGIEVETAYELHNGDGLSFFDEKGELFGFRVNRVEGKAIYPADFPEKLESGAKLFRNHDEVFEKTLSGRTATRKIAVNALFEETSGGFRLTFADEDGITASEELHHEKIPAKDATRATEAIQTQISKLGETPFGALGVKIAASKPFFIPTGKLNELRRDCAKALENNRIKEYRRPVRGKESEPPPAYPQRNLDYSHNVYNASAKRFYQKHGVESAEDAFERGKTGAKATLMTMKHCLRRSMGLCGKNEEKPLFVEIGGALFAVEFDCEKCLMSLKEN